MFIGSTNFEPSELQSCDCYGEAFLSVQQYKNRYVLTGLFIPDSVLLVNNFNYKIFYCICLNQGYTYD